MPNQKSVLKSWYKKITGQYKKSYDYNYVYFRYSDLELYSELCLEIKKFISVNSLIPENNPIEFTIAPVQLIKLLGRPVTIVEISKKPKIEVYLYKTVEEGEKLKILFHFFEGNLMLITRVYPYAANDKILELQNNFLSKFDEPLLSDTKNRICFKDTLNQYLFLFKDVEYAEHFLKPSDEFISFLKDKANQEQQNSISKVE